MKNLIIVFIAFFAFGLLQSCNKEKSTDLDIVSNSSNGLVTQYCAEIDDYVAENYPSNTIDSVVIQDIPAVGAIWVDAHAVALSDGAPCLIFDMDCNFLTEYTTCPE